MTMNPLKKVSVTYEKEVFDTDIFKIGMKIRFHRYGSKTLDATIINASENHIEFWFESHLSVNGIDINVVFIHEWGKDFQGIEILEDNNEL